MTNFEKLPTIAQINNTQIRKNKETVFNSIFKDKYESYIKSADISLIDKRIMRIVLDYLNEEK